MAIRIKVLKAATNARGSFKGGEVIEVSQKTARSMIDAGLAELYKPKPKKRKKAGKKSKKRKAD